MIKERDDLVNYCLGQIKNTSSVGLANRWKYNWIGRIRNTDRVFQGDARLKIDNNTVAIIKV